jgi:hypothetical protein
MFNFTENAENEIETIKRERLPSSRRRDTLIAQQTVLLQVVDRNSTHKTDVTISKKIAEIANDIKEIDQMWAITNATYYRALALERFLKGSCTTCTRHLIRINPFTGGSDYSACIEERCVDTYRLAEAKRLYIFFLLMEVGQKPCGCHKTENCDVTFCPTHAQEWVEYRVIG